jgi:serine/threonine protein kinase
MNVDAKLTIFNGIDTFFLNEIINRPSEECVNVAEWLSKHRALGESLVGALEREGVLLDTASRIIDASLVGNLALPTRQALFSPRGLDWLRRCSMYFDHDGEELGSTIPHHFAKIPGLLIAPDSSLAMAEFYRAEAQLQDLEISQTVGSYRIRDLLGQGDKRSVYRAENVFGGAVSAVKVIPTLGKQGAALGERFLNGALVASCLGVSGCHPIHLGSRDFGCAFLVMPLVDEGSVHDRHQRAPLAPDEATSICAQAARTLAAIHSAGYAHGNIKVGNILLGRTGVMLTDFSLPDGALSPHSPITTILQQADVAALLGIYGELLGPELFPWEQNWSAHENVPTQCRALSQRHFASAVSLADALEEVLSSFTRLSKEEVIPTFVVTSDDPATATDVVEEKVIQTSHHVSTLDVAAHFFETTQEDEQRISLPKVGDTLGKCLLTGKIGEGSTGLVFRAMHQTLGIQVAVKVLATVAHSHQELAGQFQAEAQMLARLNHPNIVRIWDFENRDDQLPYLILEYIDGQNLADLIKMRGTLTVPEIIVLFTQAVTGLKAAHQQTGLIHRDIKPANILLASDGTVKVADLGLASILENEKDLTAKIAGTPAYMPPEQFDGIKRTDHRSDIYSLGVTMYEAATGVVPFRGKSRTELIYRHASEPPLAPEQLNPAIPVGLSAIILKMLAKKPEDRFQNYDSILGALNALASATAAKNNMNQGNPKESSGKLSSLKRLLFRAKPPR